MHNSFKKIKRNTGLSLIEILIGSAIISVTLVSMVAAYAAVERYAFANMHALKATHLAEEGVEAIKFMRDSGWASNISSLSDNTAYHLYWDGSKWTSTTSEYYIDTKFDRVFTLSPVNRDGSYNVVSSGGSPDSNSRKATVTVSWRGYSATSTKVVEVYLFNIFNN